MTTPTICSSCIRVRSSNVSFGTRSDFEPVAPWRQAEIVHMGSPRTFVIVTAAIFALLHVIVVAVPLLLSGGSGEAQAFIIAIFDLPIVWLLGLFPSGRAILYGSSPSAYLAVFGLGGTLMYAAFGALLAWAIHSARRGMRAT